MLPFASTWNVTSSSPPGAGGVVLEKLGEVTSTPFTFILDPAPYTASMSRKFSARTSSMPNKDKPMLDE
jgi:hypothetical protein